MIVWLNGTFGVGKTTTAALLAKTLPARVFDSEHIGYLLRHIIGDLPHRDFKEWRPWRELTIATARSVHDYTGDTLVIPQSVLQHDYWTELVDGFKTADLPVRAYTLHADRPALTERIETDTVETSAAAWRLDHRDRYEQALTDWMARETTVIDTTDLTPDQVTARIDNDLQT